MLDSCEQGQASEIREVVAAPESNDDDIMEAEASIQHESKVRPDEVFLLQQEVVKERKVDAPRKNSFESHKNLEISKIIADGIRAAEALEESIRHNGTDLEAETTTEGNEISPNTVSEAVELLPTFLTPPRGQTVRPFRYEVRPPINKQQKHQNHSSRQPQQPVIAHYKKPGPQVIRLIYKDTKPVSQFVFREQHNTPIRKIYTDQRNPIKLPLPPSQPSVPVRRDFISKIKRHPVPTHQNHAPTVPLRKGTNFRGQYNGPKNKFQAPYSIKKDVEKEQTSIVNDGFRPSSVIIESGFLPINKNNQQTDKNDSREVEEDLYEEYDDEQPADQKIRRSDQILDTSDALFPNNESEGEIKSFEPMFIPSPLDSTSHKQQQTLVKKLTDELNDMEMEDGEDKLAMAGERLDAYYLPPDNRQKITKLFPEGAVVAYDGKAVLDMPGPAPPSRSINLRARISSTEQLLNTPQFGPFRGEFPPLTSHGSKDRRT